MKVYKPTSKYSKQADTKINKNDFSTYLVVYGKRIIRSRQGTTGTSTIYTVPDGVTFFLISVAICLSNNSTTTSSRMAVSIGALVTGGENATVICDIDSILNSITTTTLVLNPPLPLRLSSGETIMVTSSDTAGVDNTTADIIGYEVNSSLIPTFL